MVSLSFLGIKKCRHEKVSADVDCAYCPDCGEYIENKWYLARCSCCNIKLKAIAQGSEILPENTFCPNCGGMAFHVEELRDLNFIDINYAALLKVTTQSPKRNYVQTWVNTNQNTEHALLGMLG